MIKKSSFLKRFVAFLIALTMMFGSFSYVYAAGQYDLYGFAIALNEATVYLGGPGSGSTGKIFKGEGVTVLNDAQIYGDSKGSTYYKIEYSTINGPKCGYVGTSNIICFPATTAVTILQTSSVWYWPDTNKFQTIGTVYQGERVVLLGVGNGWCYIEYNTNSGRKRGYVSKSCIGSDKGITSSWPQYRETKNLDKAYDVYAGPSRQYVRVGSVSKGELVDFLDFAPGSYHGNTKTQYIAYNVPGQKMKAGYIIISE